MTKDEALKMAIDFAQRGGSISVPQYYIERDKLINACKEALEQPAQEPVAFKHKNTSEFCTGGFELKELNQWIPLYTHPYQWQGLTKYEIIQADNESNDLHAFARAIEAKLKEKNKC